MQFGHGRLRRAVLARAVAACHEQTQLRFPNLIASSPQASVLIPLVNATEASILFEVRARGLRQHAGEVSFPGGFLEAGEESLCGAIRETNEETGWTVERHSVLGQIGLWYNRKTNIRVMPWVYCSEELFDIRKLKINVAEVDHIFLARLVDLMDPGKVEMRHLHASWPPVPFFRPDNHHVIWGFTGFVLAAFLNELKYSLALQNSSPEN